MGLYIAMHDPHAVQVGHHSDQLQGDLSLISFGEDGLPAMDQIKQRPFFDQLHNEAKLRWRRDGPQHEDDIGVSVLGQHVDFVIELIQELLGDVGIEDLLDGYVQLEEFALVDGAEAAHGDLFPDLEVGLFEH